MSIRKLALISTTALGLAFAGTALAQEDSKQHEGHHPGATDSAATTNEAGSADGAMAEDGATATGEASVAPGMMMCQPMMAQMMGKGSMMSKMGMMSGRMMESSKDGRPMMGMAMMGPEDGAMAHGGVHKLVSVDAIKAKLEKMIADNKRLKLGKIEPGGDFSLSAEITTVDGSLVRKLLIDRRDGQAYDVE